MPEVSFERVQEAVELSFLAGFPEAALAKLLSESRLVELPIGTSNVGRADAPQAGIVIDGLIRLFMASPEGRQVTVRYARAGATLGVVASVGGSTPVSGQALAATTLLAFNPLTLAELAQQDHRIAWAMAQELSRVLVSILEGLSANTFGSTRQKVALHILSIATIDDDAEHLVAAVSQQDLADAIGSVREVVARTISDMTRLGLVHSTRSGIRILDAAGLHEASWSASGAGESTTPP